MKPEAKEKSSAVADSVAMDEAINVNTDAVAMEGEANAATDSNSVEQETSSDTDLNTMEPKTTVTGSIPVKQEANLADSDIVEQEDGSDSEFDFMEGEARADIDAMMAEASAYAMATGSIADQEANLPYSITVEQEDGSYSESDFMKREARADIDAMMAEASAYAMATGSIADQEANLPYSITVEQEDGWDSESDFMEGEARADINAMKAEASSDAMKGEGSNVPPFNEGTCPCIMHRQPIELCPLVAFFDKHVNASQKNNNLINSLLLKDTCPCFWFYSDDKTNPRVFVTIATFFYQLLLIFLIILVNCSLFLVKCVQCVPFFGKIIAFLFISFLVYEYVDMS